MLPAQKNTQTHELLTTTPLLTRNVCSSNCKAFFSQLSTNLIAPIMLQWNNIHQEHIVTIFFVETKQSSWFFETQSDTITAFNDLGLLLSPLGLQESLSKACPPTTVLTCLGVEIDMEQFTLSVSREHLVELEQLLNSWLQRKSASQCELQSLIGKLVFVSKFVHQSHVFIAQVLLFLRRVALPHHHIN